MNIINNLSLNRRILFGYIFSLLLIILVGGVAINRLFVLNRMVNELATNLTVDRQIPNDLIAKMLEVRYYSAQYIHKREAKYWEEYSNSLLDVENYLNLAKKNITSPNLVKIIDDLSADIVNYKETNNQIKLTIDKQDSIKTEILDVQSALGEEKLSELIYSVYQENDLVKYHNISMATNYWSLMRGDALEYIQDGDAESVKKFHTHYKQLLSLLQVLKWDMDEEIQQPLYNEINTAVEAYTSGFQSLQDYRQQQTDVQSSKLDGLDQQILDNASLLVEGVGDEFNVAAQNADNMVNRALWILSITIAVMCLVNIICGLQIARSITKPLYSVLEASRLIAEIDLPALSENMNALAEGDLTRELILTAQKVDIVTQDEIGKLAQSFNAITTRLLEVGISFRLMVVNLHRTITAVAKNASNLSAASTQLAASANQASLATTQIAATVQQVAKGTTQQSESVTKTAASVEMMSLSIESVARGAQEQAASVSKASNLTMQISSTIQRVSGNASAVTVGSASTSEAANRGSITVQETIQGMQSIKNKVGFSVQKVQEMGQRSNQIGIIVETIEDIASQTNLLALNAAIEAARAGEHGKGFAVVADEVRKLAERSSSATKEIGNLIKGIQKTVNEAVVAMEESATEVESGVTLANEAGGALDAITNAARSVLSEAEQTTKAASKMTSASNELVTTMDSVSEVVEENTMATEAMAVASIEVSTAIENIASVSEENSAAIEEVSASTEEMSAQVEEVTASAQSLADMAHALQALVDQFKLNAVDEVENDQPAPKVEEEQGNKPIYLGPDRRAPMLYPEKTGNGGNGQKMGIQN